MQWVNITDMAWPGKNIYFIDILRYRFGPDFALATGHMFAPSEFLVIYFVCGDLQPSNPCGAVLLCGAVSHFLFNALFPVI